MRSLLLLLALCAANASARDLLAPPKCALPKLLCDGVCVNGNLPNNCGACGNVCRPGESCAGNPKRCKCGPLNASCGPLESCRDDVCVCNPGLTRCDGACKNLLTDPASCGACGNACTGAGLSGQCVDGVCECAPGFVRCGDQCINVLGDDVNNCGGCGETCPEGNVCEAGVCKCTSSAQCPDEAPICGADGKCGLCTYAGDKGLPCAVRAAALGTTEFQCNYAELGGNGRCVECNLGPRAKDNDCAFLIDHSAYPEAASVPTIPATYTYCSAEKKCIPPPVRR
ncbi:hypothetical protein COHA_005117 [Chlorella ohadii]|uniref:Uncharacterized protein n=1 Tax=Chlorella ohadii TaxID=2649997 RepID=A0AAD5DNN1_9CHLO|nr:hypothetical protein COHA_005117 [Chlorella ohadii]